MSDTPRTDAKLIQVWDNETGEIKTLDMVYASFARVLERELAAERVRLKEAAITACRNAQMKVLVWYPENTRSYIHPNQLAGIYESQTTECMAAIEEVFEPGVLKRLAKNEEAAS